MMNILLIGLLAVSLLAAVLVSAGLARLFKAKCPFVWLAFLVVLVAIATGWAVHTYYVNDSVIVLASALAMYIVLLLLVMRIGVLETLVTSLATVTVIGLVLFAGGMALDKYQHSQLVDVMMNYVRDNQSFISFPAVSSETKQNVVQGVVDDNHEDEFILYSEAALLPDGAIAQQNGLNNKTYQTIALAKAHTVKGRFVRVVKKEGEILKGMLIEIRKNSLVLRVYIPSAKGMIIVPIAMSVVRKLEVYQ